MAAPFGFIGLGQMGVPIVCDVGDMLRGYELIESLADSQQHVIAGHDPLVNRMYRSAGPTGLEIVSLTEPL